MTTSDSDDIFSDFTARYTSKQGTTMSLLDFLDLCKADPSAYASSHQRMLAAIGEPIEFDSQTDPRSARLFMNSKIRIYPQFADFYGMEEVIEKAVAYFKHVSQGLE